METTHESLDTCIFCMIYNRSKDKIVHETKNTFTIHDIKSKSARYHLLVCPKSHIKHMLVLTPDHIDLLYEMKDAAAQVGHSFAPSSKIVTGFHKPPLYSVKHLHLHVVIPPITNAHHRDRTFGSMLHSLEARLKELEIEKEQKNKQREKGD